MRLIGIVGILAVLAGCTGGDERQVASVPEAETGLGPNHRPGCYTVDLFKPVPVETPTPEVPPEYAAFLGRWGNGWWNGSWCHDLLIHAVHADGRAELLDMHAPSEKYAQPASIFKRTGRIREDGTLYFAHGLTRRRYVIENGVMRGLREDGAHGRLEIVMTRKGVVPLPRPRPVRIARGPVSDTAAE